MELHSVILKTNSDKDLKTSSASLEEELNHANAQEKIDHQEKCIKNLELKIRKSEESKSERSLWLKKMATISESKEKDLENLQNKLNLLTSRRNHECRYGRKCRRLYCNFDHRYVFVKDNRKSIPSAECDDDFEMNEHLETNHENTQHTSKIQLQGRQFRERQNANIVNEEINSDVNQESDSATTNSSFESIENTESSETDDSETENSGDESGEDDDC